VSAALGGPWSGTPTLRLKRWYEATPFEVFRAFTDPDRLRQWWKPQGFVVEALDFQARTGASYRVRLRAPDGTPFEHVGTVLEVDAPTRLAYSWRWIEGPLDGTETLVELTFIAERGGVTVDLSHSRFANQAECDKHVGWQQSFDRLASWLAAGGAADSATS
jgi:uncharacterized protein YndB with AHSA1/START domain